MALRSTRVMGWALLGVLILSFVYPSAAEEGNGYRHVRSLREIRQENMVRQRWDMSCGAAALSTLLTYDLKKPTSESEVVVWILRRTDPVRVQARGGFSLWDLKRFALSRGLQADGYAGLSLDELDSLKLPAIVPIKAKNVDHFVVFRGMRGDRVVLADPAFGNMTMTKNHFTALWKGGIAFVVQRRGTTSMAEVQTDAAATVPDGTSLYRSVLGTGIGRPTH